MGPPMMSKNFEGAAVGSSLLATVLTHGPPPSLPSPINSRKKVRAGHIVDASKQNETVIYSKKNTNRYSSEKVRFNTSTPLSKQKNRVGFRASREISSSEHPSLSKGIETLAIDNLW